jgi:hypothetical protein
MTTTIEVKERPILFSGAMIRALLDGKKTQTRRVVKPQPVDGEPWPDARSCLEWNDIVHDTDYYVGCEWCPYGQPGDRLWVHETWQINHVMYDRGPIPKEHPVDFGQPVDLIYRADGEFDEQFEIDEGGSCWRPSIHMPRWASRLTLEVTGVRVERVQQISVEDMRAEGFQPNNEVSLLWRETLAENFRTLWDEINPKHPWDSNPWVWVVEFKRVQQ